MQFKFERFCLRIAMAYFELFCLNTPFQIKTVEKLRFKYCFTLNHRHCLFSNNTLSFHRPGAIYMNELLLRGKAPNASATATVTRLFPPQSFRKERVNIDSSFMLPLQPIHCTESFHLVMPKQHKSSSHV